MTDYLEYQLYWSFHVQDDTATIKHSCGFQADVTEYLDWNPTTGETTLGYPADIVLEHMRSAHNQGPQGG